MSDTLLVDREFLEALYNTLVNGEFYQDYNESWDTIEKLRNVLRQDVSEGALAILEERLRQQDTEGWTPEHDDEYENRELRNAAVCYIGAANVPENAQTFYDEWGHDYRYSKFAQESLDDPYGKWYGRDSRGELKQAPDAWPWSVGWWKPADPIRNLEKAGALIAAEIDRLKRCQAE